MTDVDATGLLALLFLVGVPPLALPLAVGATAPRASATSTFGRALAAVAAAVLALGLLAGVAVGFDAEAALVPLAVGTALARARTGRAWDVALRTTTWAWVPAPGLAAASWTHLPMAAVLSWGGTGAGVAVALAAYLAAVGAVSGGLSAAFLRVRRRRMRGAPSRRA